MATNGASSDLPVGRDFGSYVRAQANNGRLVVQPRMGMADPAVMRRGITRVWEAPGSTVATITVDSYTRVGDYPAAEAATRDGRAINGYPIVAHPDHVTRQVVAPPRSDAFVQVRHGSAQPGPIFRAMSAAGLYISEGGPVSYCLPYGRTPLATSISRWAEATRYLTTAAQRTDVRAHLETFGGCMLGQLCPPSLLVALSVLEGLFFTEHGVQSLSLSYAQQTNAEQDVEAIQALRRLAGEILPRAADWHVVVYTYMGVFPRTELGAAFLLDTSVDVARSGGAERLIMKTPAEAFRIPTIAENIAALSRAHARSVHAPSLSSPTSQSVNDTYTEAAHIVSAVLDQPGQIGSQLLTAFHAGLLDVPYCLHQDNAGNTQAGIDHDGRLAWTRTGRTPVRLNRSTAPPRVTSESLLRMLHYVARGCDDILPAARASIELPIAPVRDPSRRVPERDSP